MDEQTFEALVSIFVFIGLLAFFLKPVLKKELAMNTKANQKKQAEIESNYRGIHYYSNMLMLHIFFTLDFLETVPSVLKDKTGEITRSYMEMPQIACYLEELRDDEICAEIREYGYEPETVSLPENAENNRLRFLFNAVLDTRQEYEELRECERYFEAYLKHKTGPQYPNRLSPAERLLNTLVERELILMFTNNTREFRLENDPGFARELYEHLSDEETIEELESRIDDLEEEIEEIKEEHKTDIENAREQAFEQAYEAETIYSYNAGKEELFREIMDDIGAHFASESESLRWKSLEERLRRESREYGWQIYEAIEDLCDVVRLNAIDECIKILEKYSTVPAYVKKEVYELKQSQE